MLPPAIADPQPDRPRAIDTERCPCCLYDRRASERSAPCSECGYVVPPGVAVINIPRQPRSKGMGIALFLAICALGFALAIDLRGAVYSTSFLFVLFIQTITREMLRWWRISLSPEEAYTSQIWVTPDGIGFVKDAEQDDVARKLEWIINSLLGVLYTVALWFSIGRRVALIALAIIALYLLVAFVVAFFQTRRTGSSSSSTIDPVMPTLTQWKAIKEIEVAKVVGSALAIRAPVHYGPYKHFRFEFRIEGASHVAGTVAKFIADHAPSNVVVTLL